jgi:hypothetical protein
MYRGRIVLMQRLRLSIAASNNSLLGSIVVALLPRLTASLLSPQSYMYQPSRRAMIPLTLFLAKRATLIEKKKTILPLS